MIDRKIIAQNITNLTDARYFAAWGVDYLSFNLIPGSPYRVDVETIREIKDWVAGPAILTESNAIEYMDISDGFILNNMYSSLPFSTEVFFRIDFDELLLGLPSGKYIIALDKHELLELRSVDPEKYLDADLYLDINDLSIKSMELWPDWGLVIQGGYEEKTGLKSFDDLDRLYELLMDEK